MNSLAVRDKSVHVLKISSAVANRSERFKMDFI